MMADQILNRWKKLDERTLAASKLKEDKKKVEEKLLEQYIELKNVRKISAALLKMITGLNSIEVFQLWQRSM